MIKALIFDCFGVLTSDTWKEYLSSLDKDVDKDAVRDAHRAYGAGLTSRQDAAEQIASLAGKPFTETSDQPSEQVSKNTRLLELISDLKKQYKIGLLSNVGDNWIADEFLTKSEAQLFDCMIFSFQVGMVKPDPRIFILACEKLGVAPEEAVMIDDVAHYCEAAKSVGMQAIAYQNLSQLKSELNRLNIPDVI